MAKGRPKIHKTPREIICQIFVDNVTARLPLVFPNAQNETEQYAALAARIGTSPETIRRTMKGHSAPRLDTVDKFARGLATTTADLLRVQEQPAEAAQPAKGGILRATSFQATPY